MRRLYGILSAQLYYYCANYHDSLAMQSCVYLIGYLLRPVPDDSILTSAKHLRILESVNTGLCVHIFYEYLIVAWGKEHAVDHIITYVLYAHLLDFLLTFAFLFTERPRFVNIFKCTSLLANIK